MLSEREVVRLTDIRDAIGHAQDFTADLSLEVFQGDVMRVLAVTRCLEIISEASRHLSGEVKDRHPDIPWVQIAAAGNVYRHGYQSVRIEVLWATVEDALPPLLAAVEAELALKF